MPAIKPWPESCCAAMDRPVEVAYAVVFLASRFADRITGQIIYVDGGFKME